MGFVDAINESAQWDRGHWQLSPGALAKSIVLSTFSDMRAPLSSLAERLEGCDLEYMLGESAADGSVNSFNAGRALERIGQADPDAVYTSLALSAVVKYSIPITRSH